MCGGYLGAHTCNPPHRTLCVRGSRKYRMSKRLKHCRPTSVDRIVQVVNNRPHPATLVTVRKTEFVELPTIFVIRQPQNQLIDHLVQIDRPSTAARAVSSLEVCREALFLPTPGTPN